MHVVGSKAEHRNRDFRFPKKKTTLDVYEVVIYSQELEVHMHCMSGGSLFANYSDPKQQHKPRIYLVS